MIRYIAIFISCLVIIAESQPAEEFCEAKVQTVVDAWKMCRVDAGINDTVIDHGCGCETETDDRKRKDCEWVARLNTVGYLNAMNTVCSANSVTGKVLTFAKPTAADDCLPESNFFLSCLEKAQSVKQNITFSPSLVPECECSLPAYTFLMTNLSTACQNVVSPFTPAAAVGYYPTDTACQNCSSSLICLPIEDGKEDSPIYEFQAELQTNNLEQDQASLKSSIAYYAEVANSQVHFFKVVLSNEPVYTVWFLLLGLPTNTTATTVAKLTAQIENTESILSTRYKMTTMNVVAEPFKEIVKTEEEIPAWMIVLFVISLTALVIAAVGGAVVFFMGGSSGEEGEEQEECDENYDGVVMSDRGDEEAGGEPTFEADIKALPGDEEQHNGG